MTLRILFSALLLCLCPLFGLSSAHAAFVKKISKLNSTKECEEKLSNESKYINVAMAEARYSPLLQIEKEFVQAILDSSLKEKFLNTSLGLFESSESTLDDFGLERFGAALDRMLLEKALHENHLSQEAYLFLLDVAEKLAHEIGDAELAQRSQSIKRQAQLYINWLVERNVGLVKKTVQVRSVHSGANNFEDHFNNGILGLIRGAKKYNPLLGFQPSTYLRMWITQAIQRGEMDFEVVHKSIDLTAKMNDFKRKKIELSKMLHRDPTANELAAAMKISLEEFQNLEVMVYSQMISLDSLVWDDNDSHTFADYLDTTVVGETDYDFLGIKLDFEKIQNAFSVLTPKEKQILEMRFAIGEYNETGPFVREEIGAHFGVSYELIRQIENKALKKMKNYLDKTSKRRLN